MPKDYIKFIKKSRYRKQLEQLVEDLANNTIQGYDCKKIRNKTNAWRIRIWPIRCVFQKIDWDNYILEINKRWDVGY